MYGSIAELRIKPGKREGVIAQLSELRNERVEGAVATYLFEVGAQPAKHYMVVVFETLETYLADAESTKHSRRYNDLLESLDAPPEWHTGEVVCAVEFEYTGL